MPEQITLFCWNNQNLFSNNYLEHRLPSTALWIEQKENALKTFKAIQESYESIKTSKLGPGEEAELENKFIQPILSALGYAYHVQPVAQRGLKKKRPDYALFKDPDSYKTSRKLKENPDRFFSHCLTILEVKYWGRRLNDTDKKDILDSRDPTAQTVKYLDDVHFHTDGKINWAILTNGKQWRLFYYRAASRSGNFFEIDLEEIIKSEEVEKFLYFYLFFSKNAFIPDPVTGKTWLDDHLKGTEEYAARISTKLKDLIFDKVFEGLAEGFVHYRKNELSIENETEENKKSIFKGCLTLLYRMLFLLYAESRNLLPIVEDAYKKVSFLKLKQDIYNDLSTFGLDKLSRRSYSYWSRLESLFDIIAKGDTALNVPIYNGGLFETSKDSFLATHKMPDPFLAEAIELLTVDHEGEHRSDTISFIDYSSLNVRHLGDIYEGLLEFHIQIAEEDIVAVRKEGKFLWLKASEVKDKIKIFGKKSKSDVYIENSKHERKATGSYYTPHYIVEYIVKNTVGPVLDERIKTVKDLMIQLEDTINTLHKQKSTAGIQGYRVKMNGIEESIFNTLFDIKVLDPAMGSGHFLVHTVDFITDRIISFLADYPDNPVIQKIAELKKEILEEINRQGVRIDESKLTEVNLIKRMVMKRCIYGVDLNDMAVELAKLSLWLDSFTLGAPLSFLDHHLKCGNSLIGIFDISDVVLPGSEAYGKVQRALSYMLQVSDLTDATISEAQKSYDLFKNARIEIEPIRRRFDVATVRYFTDLGTSFGRVEQLAYTLDYDNEPYPEIIDKCKTALSLAEEKRFFHWRIEFPEVFYSERGEKENSGFDCVIGNPPYGISFDRNQKDYLNKRYIAAEYQLESFTLFIEQAILLARHSGFQSYITPTPWLSMHYYENLRKYILSDYWLRQIIFFKEPVFEDATVETCIEIVQKNKTNSKSITMLGVVYEQPDHLDIKWVDIIQDRIKQFEGNRITEYLTPNLLDLFEKVNGRSTLLKDIADICNGLKPYEVGKGNPPQTRKTVEDRIFDADINKGPTYKQYLRGEDFFRFDLNPQSSRWLSYGEWLAAPRPTTPFFYSKKIIIRQTSDTIIATIDDKQYLNLNNVHNLVLKEDKLSLEFILALLNSKFLSFIHRVIVPEFGRVFAEVKIVNLEKLPIPRISFTTPEQERKKRVDESIELYKNYMVDLERGYLYEKAENSDQYDTTLERKPHSGGEEDVVSGEHSRTGKRIHGLRGRSRRPEDAERVSEEIERYPSTTRFIESSLGIKSYTELAPYLAKGVERVMAQLLQLKPDELTITSEFICKLHKDAFGELFPSWAGSFRDRNVTVSKHAPPPYFEVPVLMRQYCDDLESRLAIIGETPSETNMLLETLSFAEGRLLSIHPFLDFNGRVARMFLFALLYRLDLPPVQLVPDEGKENEKAEYLNALSEADTFNWQPLIDIWHKRLGVKE